MKAFARLALVVVSFVVLGGPLVGSLAGCGGGGDAEPDAGAPDARPVRSDAPLPMPCGPGAEAAWVQEGSPLAVVVGCTLREAGPGDAFAMPDLPAGATFDPATRTLAWTPGLDQAANWSLAVSQGEDGDDGTIAVGVLDNFLDPENVPVDPTTYLEEHGLPVIHLTTAPAINFDTYAPATVVYRGRSVLAEAKLRGQISADYPKNSYTIKFPEAEPFEEPTRGFVGRRKIAVTTTFDDNSYLRNRMAFALWNRLDATHVQMAQMSAILFVDGSYAGLYSVSDHVSRHLFAAQGLDETGNLYKSDTNACNFRLTFNNGDPKTSLHQGYEKKEGTPLDGEVGAYDDLDELVSWVATSDDTTFAAELSTRLDRREFEDWWILVGLIEAGDSAGKNSFLWHTTAGPWRYVPWDFNASFGQTYETQREWFEEPPMAYDWANELWARMFLNPEINAALRVRWATALAGPLLLADVLALYDGMVEEVRASALRDEAMWGDAYVAYAGWSFRVDFLTAAEEFVYVRQWLESRWLFASDPELAFP